MLELKFELQIIFFVRTYLNLPEKHICEKQQIKRKSKSRDFFFFLLENLINLFLLGE